MIPLLSKQMPIQLFDSKEVCNCVRNFLDNILFSCFNFPFFKKKPIKGQALTCVRPHLSTLHRSSEFIFMTTHEVGPWLPLVLRRGNWGLEKQSHLLTFTQLQVIRSGEFALQPSHSTALHVKEVQILSMLRKLKLRLGKAQNPETRSLWLESYVVLPGHLLALVIPGEQSITVYELFCHTLTLNPGIFRVSW